MSILDSLDLYGIAPELRDAVIEMERKARCWDDLRGARTKPHTELDAEWMALADAGSLIQAIKACRAAHGYGLFEAKAAVAAYAQSIRGHQP